MDMRIVYVDVCCAHGDCVFVVIVVIVVIEARSNSNWSISDSTRDTYDVQHGRSATHTESNRDGRRLRLARVRSTGSLVRHLEELGVLAEGGGERWRKTDDKKEILEISGV